MTSLYIYNSTDDKHLTDVQVDYIYNLSIGTAYNNNSFCIDDTERFNDLALDLKGEYCNFIYSINNFFNKLGLFYQKKLSLYFIADVSGKRTERFDTYSTVIHVSYLRECINKYDIEKIYIFGCDKNQIQSILSLKKDLNISIINSVDNDYTWLRWTASQLKFFLNTIFCIFIGKFFIKKKPNPKRVKRLFLTRYPLHLNNNLEEEKYGGMLEEGDFYLVGMVSDGIHQYLPVSKYFHHISKISKKSHKYVFIDSYLSVIECITNFIFSFLLLYKARKLFKKDYEFNSINISGYIYQELMFSFLRIPRLFLYNKAIKEILDIYKIQEFFYYLHEYSFGRFFTYILDMYFPKIKKTGFQHGPASRRKLLYSLAEGEADDGTNDYILRLPIPDRVLAEDELSVGIYKDSGYRNVNKMEKIFRLEYLNTIKRNNVDKNKILIACGLHDGLFLLRSVYDEIIKHQNNKYLVKLHPKANSDEIISWLEKSDIKNCELVNEKIDKILCYVGEVISSYSSVGLEAKYLGIPVKLVSIRGKINESPLLDINENNNPHLSFA